MYQTSLITPDLAAQIEAQVLGLRRWTQLHRSVRSVVVVIFVAGLVFSILTAPAQWERLSYTVTLWFEALLPTTPERPSSVRFSPSWFLGHSASVAPAQTAVTLPTGIGSNQLHIPVIGVEAAVMWDVPLAEALNGLQEGVVQLDESVEPSEVGRTFVVGHSAGYWWQNNPWTKVFTLLDKLEPGAAIYLATETHIYEYRATDHQVVKPSDVHVITDSTLTKNQLVLMTCTPVGTTLNRLLVLAEPVATYAR